MRKKKVALTALLPEPPAEEKEKALNVDVGSEVSWRIKLALLVLEGEGQKTPKKKFVEDLIVKGLDRFDAERAR